MLRIYPFLYLLNKETFIYSNLSFKVIFKYIPAKISSKYFLTNTVASLNLPIKRSCLIESRVPCIDKKTYAS